MYLHEHLVSYDDSPQGDRLPLLLVHGIQATETWFNWARFLAYASQQDGFNKRFKVYLFHCDPTISIKDGGQRLLETLQWLIRQSDKPIFAIANSQGGLYFMGAMTETAVQARVQKIVSVGVPFHGTPIVHAEWMDKLFKIPSFPGRLFSLMLKAIYPIVRYQYPNYRDIYCWENFDFPMRSDMPDIGSEPANRPVLPPEASRKFMAYGSFFGIEKDAAQQLLKHLGANADLPPERFYWKLLEPKHIGLTAVENILLRRSLLALHARSAIPPLLSYNDGVSSISSTLWVGRFVERAATEDINRAVWEALPDLKQSAYCRLFAGIDHRNWMEGSTRTRQCKVLDLLHPDLPARTIFDWYLYDLLENASV